MTILKYALEAIAGAEAILKGFVWSYLGVQFEGTGHDANGNPIICVLQPKLNKSKST
jgi:hypothetical protein